jgi:hypothetical protein
VTGRVIGDDEEARQEALAEAERIEAAQEEDFDAFWSGVGRKATSLRNVFGVDVTLPAALPLRFEVEARAVADSQDPDNTKRMVGILFGEDALDRWTAAGMDIEQFAVLLLWGTSNTRLPDSMSLAEARAAYLERLSDPGKAPSPEVALASGSASSATGPPSKRTSRASTGSRKKK